MVKEKWPVLSQAILAGASTQLRNMASVGGNLLQDNRRGYFRDVAMPCNRREPGTGCGALGEQSGVEGINRYCAVLGTSPSCIAAHPSDMCVALVAVDATVKISNPSFDRLERIRRFLPTAGRYAEHSDPAWTGRTDHRNRAAAPAPGVRSMYLKVRDRTSYAYALTSVAVALTQDAEGRIDHIRVGLGGVGSVPWRSHEAENVLLRNLPTEAVFREAAEAAFAAAVPINTTASRSRWARTRWSGS